MFSRVPNSPSETSFKFQSWVREHSGILFTLPTVQALQKLPKYKLRNCSDPRRGSGWVFAASTIWSCTGSAPNFPAGAHGVTGTGEISALCKWFCIYLRLMSLFTPVLFAHPFRGSFHDVLWQMFRCFFPASVAATFKSLISHSRALFNDAAYTLMRNKEHQMPSCLIFELKACSDNVVDIFLLEKKVILKVVDII